MNIELLTIGNVRDNKGARRRRKTLGRGIGSGKGKTSGRGGKGQTARSGVSIGGFEGGQTPIYRRMPKRGFNNPFKKSVYELDFIKISRIIKNNLLPENGTIDRDLLIKIGYMPKYINNITLLANGKLEKGVTVKVTKVTANAKKILEQAGGKIIEDNGQTTISERDK